MKRKTFIQKKYNISKSKGTEQNVRFVFSCFNKFLDDDYSKYVQMFPLNLTSDEQKVHEKVLRKSRRLTDEEKLCKESLDKKITSTYEQAEQRIFLLMLDQNKVIDRYRFLDEYVQNLSNRINPSGVKGHLSWMKEWLHLNGIKLDPYEVKYNITLPKSIKVKREPLKKFQVVEMFHKMNPKYKAIFSLSFCTK